MIETVNNPFHHTEGERNFSLVATYSVTYS